MTEPKSRPGLRSNKLVGLRTTGEVEGPGMNDILMALNFKKGILGGYLY